MATLGGLVLGIGCTALLLHGCVGLLPGASTRFEFALIGDMPYDARTEREFAHVMRDIDAANLAFVVHNGDFWGDGAFWSEKPPAGLERQRAPFVFVGGYAPCADETFAHRLQLANESRHPFILVPGDNEWADCHRAKPRAYEPLERLAKLRQMFFSGKRTLGRRTLTLSRQSDDPRYAKFRENVRWTHGEVLFVTLHVIGSNNNMGRNPEMDAEYAERDAANRAWMRDSLALAARSRNRGVMIIAQANPGFESNWTASLQRRYVAGLALKPPAEPRATGFDEFLAELETAVRAFGKPVVYVHGDTHIFRVDKPLVGTTSGRIIENFTRVETFGFPDTHWVRGIVDSADPNVFSFRQEIVKANLVPH